MTDYQRVSLQLRASALRAGFDGKRVTFADRQAAQAVQAWKAANPFGGDAAEILQVSEDAFNGGLQRYDEQVVPPQIPAGAMTGGPGITINMPGPGGQTPPGAPKPNRAATWTQDVLAVRDGIRQGMITEQAAIRALSDTWTPQEARAIVKQAQGQQQPAKKTSPTRQVRPAARPPVPSNQPEGFGEWLSRMGRGVGGVLHGAGRGM